jgi:AcrR family transcriptional regulator
MTEDAVLRRQRTNDPAGLRRRLLDVAAEAFQTVGYHSTSIHDVMRAAGVTGGALHHHFPTKKALGLAVLRERVAEAVETTWIAPVRNARSAPAGIANVFARIIAMLEERRAVSGCPLNNLALELSLADPDFRGAIRSIFDDWRSAVAERIRADHAAGRSRHLDPEPFATFVVASYSGAMAMAKAAQDVGPLRECARQLARTMKPPQRGARRAGSYRP